MERKKSSNKFLTKDEMVGVGWSAGGWSVCWNIIILKVTCLPSCWETHQSQWCRSYLRPPGQSQRWLFQHHSDPVAVNCASLIFLAVTQLVDWKPCTAIFRDWQYKQYQNMEGCSMLDTMLPVCTDYQYFKREADWVGLPWDLRLTWQSTGTTHPRLSKSDVCCTDKMSGKKIFAHERT